MMTSDISKIHSLPDIALLTLKQVAALTGLSEQTLRALANRGEGPPRIQLSPYRQGYQIGALKRWMAQRTTAGDAA